VPREDSEFKIDTHASYHGLTLKTVTEGAAPNKFLVNHFSYSKSNYFSCVFFSQSTTNQSIPKPIAASNDKLHSSNTDSSKRPSRTPIIVIPPALTSLITRYNCKEILEDLK
jgi:parafibromin